MLFRSALLKELGATRNRNGTYTVPSVTELQKVLQREVDNRGLSDNYANAIELVKDVDGQLELNMPDRKSVV